MCSPSVAGVPAQYGFESLVRSSSVKVTPFCQRSLPSVRLKHISVRLFSFSTACDTNTRSPHTMGEEFPGPGKGTRQRTLSVLLHLSGSIASEETPEPCGPRQAGQFSATIGSAIE